MWKLQGSQVICTPTVYVKFGLEHNITSKRCAKENEIPTHTPTHSLPPLQGNFTTPTPREGLAALIDWEKEAQRAKFLVLVFMRLCNCDTSASSWRAQGMQSEAGGKCALCTSEPQSKRECVKEDRFEYYLISKDYKTSNHFFQTSGMSFRRLKCFYFKWVWIYFDIEFVHIEKMYCWMNEWMITS